MKYTVYGMFVGCISILFNKLFGLDFEVIHRQFYVNNYDIVNKLKNAPP